MKYRFTDETKQVNGITLHRIEALIDINADCDYAGRVYNVHAGDKGGWVESEDNLSNDENDTCWVYNDAAVYGNARVLDDSKVMDTAEVYDNAKISGEAIILGNAHVYGNALVSEHACVYGFARIYDNAKILKHTLISGKASVYGNSTIVTLAGEVSYNAEIFENVYINTHSLDISDFAKVHGNLVLKDDIVIKDTSEVMGNAEINGCYITGNFVVNGIGNNIIIGNMMGSIIMGRIKLPKISKRYKGS